MHPLARSASEGNAEGDRDSGFGNRVATNDSQFADLIERLTDRIAARDLTAVESILQANPDQADRLRRLLPTLEVLAALESRVGCDKAAQAATGTPAIVDNSVGRRSQSSLVPPYELLGDYRIVREIGRGGMGIVYEAEQLSLRRRVALKVLPLAALLDERLLQRFKNEAQAAAGLAHLNIVPIYAVGCEQGIHYYAMQLIEGLSLTEVIESLKQQAGTGGNRGNRAEGLTEESKESKGGNGNLTEGNEGNEERQEINNSLLPLLPSVQNISSPFPLFPPVQSAERYRRIAELGIQAAEALHYAHERGIIHRDIKPGNLLLGSDGKLWITDFGLAAIEGSPQLTMTGDLLGTLRYMSPEQAAGIRVAVDRHTDIYSLGATLYELLSGHPVAPARNRPEILRQIADEDPVSLRKQEPRIPIELETIVCTAIAKDPADRYASAGALAADLRRWLDSTPIAARPPTLAKRCWKWTRRHVATITTSLLIAAAMTIGSLLLSFVLASRLAGLNFNPQASVDRSSDPSAKKYLDSPGATDQRTSRDERSAGRWNLNRMQPRRFADHPAPITDLCFSPDGSQLVTACRDGKVRVFEVASGALLKELVLQAVSSVAARISPNGSLLAGLAKDRTLVLWDVGGWEATTFFMGDGREHRDGRLAFTSDGALLADTATGNVRLWNVASGELLQTLAPPGTDTYPILALPVSNSFLLGNRDGTIQQWDWQDGSLRTLPSRHPAALHSLALSPDGDRLVSTSASSDLQKSANASPVSALAITRLGSTAEFQLLETRPRDYGPAAWSPLNQVFAVSGGELYSLRLWDAEWQHQISAAYLGDRRQAEAIAFSSDGQQLAAAVNDRSIPGKESGYVLLF